MTSPRVIIPLIAGCIAGWVFGPLKVLIFIGGILSILAAFALIIYLLYVLEYNTWKID